MSSIAQQTPSSLADHERACLVDHIGRMRARVEAADRVATGKIPNSVIADLRLLEDEVQDLRDRFAALEARVEGRSTGGPRRALRWVEVVAVIREMGEASPMELAQKFAVPVNNIHRFICQHPTEVRKRKEGGTTLYRML